MENKSQFNKYYQSSKRQLNIYHQNINTNITNSNNTSNNTTANSDDDIEISKKISKKMLVECECEISDQCNLHSSSNDSGSCTDDDSFHTNLFSTANCSAVPLTSSCTNFEYSEITHESLEICDKSLKTQLSQWAVKHSITHLAVNDLLSILKPYHSELPGDVRTLLHTPREIKLKTIEPGVYCHFGVKKCILKLLSYLHAADFIGLKEIELCVNVDGLPISKSSGSQLYPILCSVFNNPRKVEMIGVYHGYEKPKDANMFLREFITDLNQVIIDGVLYDGQIFKVKVKCFICDVPAKSFITYTKGHAAYMSCTKCCAIGEYFENRVCFPDTRKIELRTDLSFRSKLQEEHHLGTSLIEEIRNVDMINCFPLDYMHLVCLGVMKKLLVSLWICGKPSTKLSFLDISRVSDFLSLQVKNIPTEFSRKPRALAECKRWKATEFRQFLLYTGPVVLKPVLSKNRYANFITFHVAITILSSQRHSFLIEYAEQLLTYFVETFISLYGEQYTSHNVHNLLHLANDVKLFGPVDNFSAFPFENFMQTIKRDLRKNNKPLEQIINRKTERDSVSSNSSVNSQKHPIFKNDHSHGPLIPNLPVVSQYKTVLLKNYSIKINSPDNCCTLSDGSIVDVKNIVLTNEGVVLLGQSYLLKENFFDLPCESSQINIFVVSEPGPLKSWDISTVLYKNVKLTYEDKHVVFPLLHLE